MGRQRSAPRTMSGSPPRFDLAIVGSGILGCALAHHAAALGAGRILLYDRDHPCAGLSARGAGGLDTTHADPWMRHQARESSQEYRAISSRWGLGAHRTEGELHLARDEQEALRLERLRATLTGEGQRAEVLGADEVRERLTAGDPRGVRSGLFMPEGATFSAAEMTFAYAELASQAGVDLRWGYGEADLVRQGTGWVVRTPAARFFTREVVVACGTRAPRLLAPHGVTLRALVERWQACRLRPPRLAAPFPSVREAGAGLYVRSSPGGRLVALLGPKDGTKDDPPTDASADFSFLERIALQMHEVLPGWEESRLEDSWAGTCLTGLDGRPWVGRSPSLPTLYVAAGLGGKGAAIAGAVAAKLARGIVQDYWKDLASVDPGRFP